jgi:hypothetical protein
MHARRPPTRIARTTSLSGECPPSEASAYQPRRGSDEQAASNRARDRARGVARLQSADSCATPPSLVRVVAIGCTRKSSRRSGFCWSLRPIPPVFQSDRLLWRTTEHTGGLSLQSAERGDTPISGRRHAALQKDTDRSDMRFGNWTLTWPDRRGGARRHAGGSARGGRSGGTGIALRCSRCASRSRGRHRPVASSRRSPGRSCRRRNELRSR